MSGTFTWNLIADIQDMWSLAFMVNAADSTRCSYQPAGIVSGGEAEG